MVLNSECSVLPTAGKNPDDDCCFCLNDIIPTTVAWSHLCLFFQTEFCSYFTLSHHHLHPEVDTRLTVSLLEQCKYECDSNASRCCLFFWQELQCFYFNTFHIYRTLWLWNTCWIKACTIRQTLWRNGQKSFDQIAHKENASRCQLVYLGLFNRCYIDPFSTWTEQFCGSVNS